MISQNEHYKEFQNTAISIILIKNFLGKLMVVLLLVYHYSWPMPRQVLIDLHSTSILVY